MDRLDLESAGRRLRAAEAEARRAPAARVTAAAPTARARPRSPAAARAAGQGLGGTGPGGGGGGGVPDTGNLGAGHRQPGRRRSRAGVVLLVRRHHVSRRRRYRPVRPRRATTPAARSRAYDFTATDASAVRLHRRRQRLRERDTRPAHRGQPAAGFNAGYHLLRRQREHRHVRAGHHVRRDRDQLHAQPARAASRPPPGGSSPGSSPTAPSSGWTSATTPAAVLDLTGYNSGGTVLFDSGHVLFGVDGVPLYVDVELTANGSGGATWHIATVQPGARTDQRQPVRHRQRRDRRLRQRRLHQPRLGRHVRVSAGQIAVQTYADTHPGHGAGHRRVQRGARRRPAGAAGGRGEPRLRARRQRHRHPADGAAAGRHVRERASSPARTWTAGSCTSPATQFGIALPHPDLACRARAPLLTLDYSAGELAAELVPVADDQFTRNYITVTRNNGSNATATLTSGPMSTAAPPDGVGTYVYTLTVYGYADAQLANLGRLDADRSAPSPTRRYPEIRRRPHPAGGGRAVRHRRRRWMSGPTSRSSTRRRG